MAKTINRCTVPGCTNPIPPGSRADRKRCDDPACETEWSRLRKAASRAKQGAPSKKESPKHDWDERVDSISEFETSAGRKKRRSRIKAEIGKSAPKPPYRPGIPPRDPLNDHPGDTTTPDPWMDRPLRVNHYHATYGMGGELNPELRINPYEEISCIDGSTERTEQAKQRWYPGKKPADLDGGYGWERQATPSEPAEGDDLGDLNPDVSLADYLEREDRDDQDDDEQMALIERIAA